MRRFRWAGRGPVAPVLALGLALAACGGSGDSDEPGIVSTILGTASRPCPPAVVVGDARQYIDMAPGPVSAENLRLAARIALPATVCDYEDDTVVVTLSVPIDARRGPQLETGSLEFDLRYFVAVTDRAGRVLGKRIFAATLGMGGDQQRTSKLEHIEQVIPLRAGMDGSHFIIYVGFQLTRAQLEFNRRNNL